MRCYETMRKNRPDFLIRSGDTIYADGPIEAEKAQPDGTMTVTLKDLNDKDLYSVTLEATPS